MATVHEILYDLPNRFDSEFARGERIIFELDFTDDETWHVVINNNNCRIIRGGNCESDVTLISSVKAFVDIVTGEINPIQGFSHSTVRTEGNSLLVSKMNDFFL